MGNNIRRELLPVTARQGTCPYCGDTLVLDEPSKTTWHAAPPCARYLEIARIDGACDLGKSRLTNLDECPSLIPPELRPS